MKTARDLSQAEIEEYRAALRRRESREAETLRAREQAAWALAHKAAELLRERFGATRVVVFGSLVPQGSFTSRSDVDIAVWGLRPEETFRALGAVMDLSPEIEFSLVDTAACRPSLLEVIEREGVTL